SWSSTRSVLGIKSIRYAYIYLSAVVFFSFQCSGYHRDLHSFPTRRSSDLWLRWGARGALRKRVSDGELRKSAEIPIRRPQLRNTDRKSTRLNSSHRTISYAVFCLKKKK